MLLLVLPINKCLKNPTTLLTQSTKVHITPNKNILRFIPALLWSLVRTSVLVKLSIVVKRYHDHDNSIKKTFNGVAYNFSGLVHYYHDGTG